MQAATEEALRPLASEEGYRRYFMNVEFWRPLVEYVCRRDAIVVGDVDVRVGIKGTYPTLIVNDRWVLKFFGRQFAGEQSYRAELAANQLVAEADVPAPRVVSTGLLLPDAADWQWPFLQIEYVHGASVGEHDPALSADNRHEVARWIARAARAIHDAPSARQSGDVTQRLRAAYAQLLQHNYAAALNTIAPPPGVAALPEHLRAQVANYLEPLAELLAPAPTQALVHADLTADHILGSVRDGAFRPRHVIDFGDAMIGDWHYDLVALHLDLFRADRASLAAFLDAYGVTAPGRRGLARRAMSLTLLHRYDLFENLPVDIDLTVIPTLEDLEQRLWDTN